MAKERWRRHKGAPGTEPYPDRRFEISDTSVPPPEGKESDATVRFREIGFLPSGKGFGMSDYRDHQPPVSTYEIRRRDFRRNDPTILYTALRGRTDY